jgi:general secretion pathway protein I
MTKRGGGFTLLEAVIALAIASLALTSIFGLLAGSKRLAFSALNDLDRALYLRAALSAAQVEKDPEYPETPADYAAKTSLEATELLEKPEAQTVKLMYALEPYTIHGRGGEAPVAGSLRWSKLSAAR